MIVKLSIAPQHLDKLPWKQLREVTILSETASRSKLKVNASGQKIIYRRHGHVMVIDIDATLVHHKMTRAEVVARPWPLGSWQNSVKRSLARQ